MAFVLLDHTGAAGRFSEALHIVQRAEYEYAFTPDWFAGAGYIRKDFDRPGVRRHFLDGTATDNYDLFGDGTVKMIFTPGHAPGHQSFLINLPKNGSILLTVDAAYTLDHWNEKALPMVRLADWLLCSKALPGHLSKTGPASIFIRNSV
jgi:N-acyl homoserine lactone hydrolase